MTWLILLALPVALVLGALLVGLSLPREHLVSRTLQLRKPREEVHALLADIQGHRGWRSGLVAVEPLGSDAWLGVRAKGPREELRIVENAPPDRLVWVLSGARGRFCGSWQFDLTPAAPGCWVTLTERTAARQPLVRFALRYLWGGGGGGAGGGPACSRVSSGIWPPDSARSPCWSEARRALRAPIGHNGSFRGAGSEVWMARVRGCPECGGPDAARGPRSLCPVP